jgi:hypothetical protein
MVARAPRYAELTGRRKEGQRQITKPEFLPPSQGGINTLDGAASTPPQDALRMINMIPYQFGTTVRKGYQEWCQAVPLGDGIKTIVPYTSKTETTNNSKLFAITSDGIYNITTQGGVPAKVMNWPVKTVNTGWCSWHAYSTLAGQFILLCDLVNGYYIYNGTTDTWAAAPALVSVDPILYPSPASTTFDFVAVWKNRVWLVQRDTGSAWYMEVGTITGKIAPFNFGNKFKYGGNLKGLWNWTLDGGEGVDDYLVAVSQGGDVLVYKGTDPAVAGEFTLNGGFWVGTVPKGRRLAGDLGGDMLLLSSYGLIQLSKLIGGLPLTDANVSISSKINIDLNKVMLRTLDQFGWEVKSFPQAQLIFAMTPEEAGQPQMQFVYSTATKSWCQFNDLPMLTGDTWLGQFYLGDTTNHVYIYGGNLDHVLLSDPAGTAQGINWETFTSFQSYGAPATFKRVQMLRPQFIGDAIPSYLIAPRFDFDMSTLPGSPAYIPPSGGIWDLSLWDLGVWGGGSIITQPPVGAFGIGRYIAIQMKGRSASELTHVGTDVMFDLGGML